MARFGFFTLIKIYAETALLLDEKSISQEASYPAQQSYKKVKSPKFHQIEFLSKYFGFFSKNHISLLLSKNILLYRFLEI